MVFETCLDHLPANTGRMFMMREFLGLESEEVCAQLGISAGNCHVVDAMTPAARWPAR